MAAAIGNQYRAKERIWRDAIMRALERRSRVDQVAELERLAEVLIDKAKEGDMAALKELGDRVEGKPAQAVALTGENGGPVEFAEVVRRVVDPRNPDA